MEIPTRFTHLTAKQLLKLYKSRSVSPVDVVRQIYTHTVECNKVLNAFCFIAPENELLEQAKESEKRWAQGQPIGILDGVPISIKDVINVQGMPSRFGSRTYPDKPSIEDSPSVHMLRVNGAIIIGKTTTCEFGWKGVTDSPLTGITRNPVDPELTCGGSSGGSAAAVAAGMGGPISLGSDGGGSVRIPASFCGVVGFKPTFGTIPHSSTITFGTLSHIGPITRSVDDAILAMKCISQPDRLSRDWYAVPRNLAAELSVKAEPNNERGKLSGLRVAYSWNLGGLVNYVDQGVFDACSKAIEVLTSLGAHVEHKEPVTLPYEPYQSFRAIWYSSVANLIQNRLTDAEHHLMDPGLIEITEEAERYRGVDLAKAEMHRANLGMRMHQLLQDYDVLITPTIPIPAFTAGQEHPSNMPAEITSPHGIDSELYEHDSNKRWFRWTPFTYPFNLTQQPAASIPVGTTTGRSDGLPVGLQVISRKFADSVVLRVCKTLEKALVQVNAPLRERQDAQSSSYATANASNENAQ